MSCKTRRNCFEVQFSLSYWYDVNNFGKIIGWWTKSKSKESWPEVDLKLVWIILEQLNESFSKTIY